MKKVYLSLLFICTGILFAQEKSTLAKPNYQQAAKFSQARLRTMIFSTEVSPNWINFSDKFWYEYSSPQGKNWYIVDPKARSKKEMFDRSEMAARITSIVRNPFDAQHLSIQNLRFKDNSDNIVRFEVQSSKDTVKSKEEIKKLTNKSDTIKKKVFFFEYNLSNNNLKEISDTTEKKDRLSWGSFNPDTTKVFYSKNYNLYWMDYANYQKAIKDEKDSTIVEHQITTDGVQYYSWGGEPYSVTTGDKKSEDEEKKKRNAVWLNWSPNGKHFAITRKDNRNLSALWVINNVGGKRPTLETYKYLMPGELDSTETDLFIFDAANLTPKRVDVQAFKNQTI